jgi:hypothetical protein
MIQILTDVDLENLKRRNRLKRLAPKQHKVVHESGRSTKNILSLIAGRASGLKKK